MATESTISVDKHPAHVPQNLVFDLDIYDVPGSDQGDTDDVHRLWKQVQDTYPKVFWTTRNGGHWILTRYDEIQQFLMKHDAFSSSENVVPQGVTPFLTPLNLDPPEHGLLRRLLMPAFSPERVASAIDHTRQVTREIIAGLRPKGHCEFVRDVARVIPAVTVLSLLNLPQEDFEYVLALSARMLPTDPDVKEAWAEMGAYVTKQIELRKADPQQDFITSLLTAKVNGQPLTDAEIFSMCLLVVAGGFDTVMSLLSFSMAFLAQHPQHYRELVGHPERFNGAIEELLRRFGTSNLGRVVRKDTTLGGVDMRVGDFVLGIFPLAGLDETVTDDPMTLDFNREGGKYLAFGTGPHTCIGLKLAKKQIRLFLEEWFSRIPECSLAPGTKPEMFTSLINGVAKLELVWKV
jgi:cytochrome P450